MKIRSTFPGILLALLVSTLVASGTPAAPHAPISGEQAFHEASKIAALNPDWQLMRGAGTSMNPYFGENSLLVVERAVPSEFRAGMIIVFTDRDGDRVAHRVVEISETGLLTTKGLNNRQNDPNPIAQSSVEGVLFGVIHTAGLGAESADLPFATGKTY